MVTKWIVTVYNVCPNRMLGMVPGVARAPIDAWRDKLDKFDVPNLPEKELFIALAGEHTERTVQKYGVEWDHIRYWCPGLDRILTHPDHSLRSTAKAPAQYHVHRDPYDLSKIYLHNPYANEIIEVPAAQRWAEYTIGLTSHQHKLCRQHELVREGQRNDPDILMRAKASIIEAGWGRLRSGTRKKLERNLVRFLSGNRSQLLQAEIAVGSASDSGGEQIPLSPIVRTPSLIASAQDAAKPNSTVTTANVPAERGTISSDEDDMNEIERLASEMASGVRTDD